MKCQLVQARSSPATSSLARTGTDRKHTEFHLPILNWLANYLQESPLTERQIMNVTVTTGCANAFHFRCNVAAALLFLTLFLGSHTLQGATLLNIDFGQSESQRNFGPAAVGQTTNDLWNFYNRDGEAGEWRTLGALTNLKLADGTATLTGLIVTNLPGSWGNGSSDEMYLGYLYPFEGLGTLSVTNLASGEYDIYVYSHDGNYRLKVGVADLGTRTCRDNAREGTPVWQEGRHYVLFSKVIVQAGEAVTLTVLPGLDGYAVISGMQLVRTGDAPSPTPLLLDVDFGAGAGPSAQQGAAVVGQAGDFWNYYTRDEAGGWRTSGVLSNLTLAGGTASQIALSVSNAPGAWGTASADSMYKDYIYPFSGIATVTVSNLPAGRYDLYVYSHDGNYQLAAGGTDFGSRSCRDTNPTGTPVWQEGVQYVRFAGVPVRADGSMVLTVRPGADGFAIISGLQIAPSAGVVSNTSPAIVEQPQSQTVFAGSNAVLSVGALGSGPLAYQWLLNGIEIPGATNALYSISGIQLNQAGAYAVKVTNSTGSTLSGDAIVVVVQEAPGNLINIDLGQSESARKTGPAAVGQSANDVWNFYNRDGESGEWRTLGALTNLKLADGTATLTGLIVTNLPGSWGNGSFDQMYLSYLYPFQGLGTLSITNLASGEYDIYVYSHDGNYGVKVGVADLGTRTCRDSARNGSPVWQESRQYVRFGKVVVQAGEAVTLTVLPGLDGYAVISGMQLVRTGDAPAPAPFLLDVDFGSGAGPSSKQGAAAVGKTSDFWNYYTRDEAGGWRTSGVLTNLTLAGGTASQIVMSVDNAPGAWSTGSLDPMYREYIYPFSGIATVTVSNLPAGRYDLYVYSHDGNYQLTAGGADFGSRSCRDTNPTGIPVWQEGVHYVRFAGVPVRADGSMVLTVRPGADGFAIISGLQIAQSTSTNTAAASKRLTVQSPGKTECVRMRFAGTPSLRYRVQASTDMITWVDIGSAIADNQGRCEFGDQHSAKFPQRFYRIVTP